MKGTSKHTGQSILTDSVWVKESTEENLFDLISCVLSCNWQHLIGWKLISEFQVLWPNKHFKVLIRDLSQANVHSVGNKISSYQSLGPWLIISGWHVVGCITVIELPSALKYRNFFS